MKKLYKSLLLILLPLISFQYGYSQTHPIEEEFTIAHFEVSTAWFKDFVEASGKIYAIDGFSDLYSIDLETNDTSFMSAGIDALTKDVNGDLVTASSWQGIKKYSIAENEWKILDKRVLRDVTSVLVNSKNMVFAVCKDGVFDVEDQKYYEAELPLGRKMHIPIRSFMDIEDNIWLWFTPPNIRRASKFPIPTGSDFKIFDTKNKIIQPNTIDEGSHGVYKINSFFNGNGKTYMTAQNYRLSEGAGFIVAFSHFSGRTLFQTSGKRWNPSVKEIYLGPGAFYNDKIYIHSLYDIYEGDTNQDLQQDENWKIVAKLPSWEQFEKAGIKKFDPTSTKLIVRDNRIIVLTPFSGIIILEGNKVRVFN